MVPTLEVIASVLPKLTKLAEGGVTIRDLLGLDEEAVLLEGVFQLLLYQRPLAGLSESPGSLRRRRTH